MTRSEARWAKLLGEDYNPDIPLDVQIAEYEAEHKPAPRHVANVKFVTQAQLNRAFETIGKAVGGWFKEDIDPRFAALEKRDWAGVWQAGKSYAKGSVITKGGSAWVATCNYPEGEPGEGKGWRLFVKRGRDGRDARPKP